MPGCEQVRLRQKRGRDGECLVERWMLARGCALHARNCRWGGAEWDRIFCLPFPSRAIIFCEVKVLAHSTGSCFSDWVNTWMVGSQYRRQRAALLRLEPLCGVQGYQLIRHLLVCVEPNCEEPEGLREPVAFDLVSGLLWSGEGRQSV